MPYVIFYYVIICYVFSESATTVLESLTNYTGKHLCWSLFFSLNWWNYINLFCMNKPYFCRFIFQIDWRHICPKNTINLLLFYGEHFYGFLESDSWNCQEKNIDFTTNISINMGHKHFEVLWSFFCTYCKGLFSL